MSDMGDDFRALREHRRKRRREEGAECEGCITNHPNRNPSILLAGQTCRWCGWTRPAADAEAPK